MAAPLLLGLLVALVVLIVFVALWRLLGAQDPIDARLQEYAIDETPAGTGSGAPGVNKRARTRLGWPTVSRMLARRKGGQRLAMSLARADLPLTAAEFTLIRLGLGVAGCVVASLRAGLVFGLPLGFALSYLPVLYLRRRHSKRVKAFTDQLADVLTMLTGGLRAGFGLTQAFEMLSRQMPAPASQEFARVVRSISLGVPVPQALRDMAERVDTDDTDLVVTAIIVQYEMGGNLAQTLETISETVRDRLQMLREIQVMTAQQRFTGYFLTVWPVLIAIALFFVNPEYIKQLFAPGWIRLAPIAAVVMEVLGFLVMKKIVDIKV
jgi:tight adherence protein B